MSRYFVRYWKRWKLLWKFLLMLCVFSPLYLWIQLQTYVDNTSGAIPDFIVEKLPQDSLVNDVKDPEKVGLHRAVIERISKDISKNSSRPNLVEHDVFRSRPTTRKKTEVNMSNHDGDSLSIIQFDGIKVTNLGCYRDDVTSNKRALRDSFSVDVKQMTITRCLRQCSNKGLRYAGLEYRSECYCGSDIFQVKATASLCDLKCSGDETEVCGGTAFISIYNITSSIPYKPPSKLSRDNSKNGYVAAPAPSHGVEDDFLICMMRPAHEPFLRDAQFTVNDAMTVKFCKDHCAEKGLVIAALTRGIQCYCGFLSEHVNLRDGKVDNEMCDTPCPGQPDLFCGGQDTLSIYHTSVEDTSCDSKSLRPPGSMPLISVCSFPGSGNTWVRYLIERATGIYTGSFYSDGDLSKKGFVGEREHYKAGKTVAVKTHRFDEEHIREYAGGILIIRNPYNAMLSEHNRKFGGHTGFANPAQYSTGTEWVDFVAGKSRTWTNTALNWLQYQPNLHVVFYEHLKNDIYGEMKKIIEFLKIPVDEKRLLCVASNPVGKFKRPPTPKTKHLDFDPFTDDMREVVSLYIKSVSMALAARNLEPLPDEYNPKLTFQSDRKNVIRNMTNSQPMFA